MNGKYIVLEGVDGSGKTTIAKCLEDKLSKLNHRVITSRQPGGTPLGQHLRTLVKTPKIIDPDIKIDELSRQMLYMVDSISFTKQLLQPALDNGINVISDRSSYISSIMYGISAGVPFDNISKILDIYPSPHIDKLYIVRCDYSIIKSRIKTKDPNDHFDNMPSDFFKSLSDIYDNLGTPHLMKNKHSSAIIEFIKDYVNIDDIEYINTGNGIDGLIDGIVDDLVNKIL